MACAAFVSEDDRGMFVNLKVNVFLGETCDVYDRFRWRGWRSTQEVTVGDAVSRRRIVVMQIV